MKNISAFFVGFFSLLLFSVVGLSSEIFVNPPINPNLKHSCFQSRVRKVQVVYRGSGVVGGCVTNTFGLDGFVMNTTLLHLICEEPIYINPLYFKSDGLVRVIVRYYGDVNGRIATLFIGIRLYRIRNGLVVNPGNVKMLANWSLPIPRSYADSSFFSEITEMETGDSSSLSAFVERSPRIKIGDRKEVSLVQFPIRWVETPYIIDRNPTRVFDSQIILRGGVGVEDPRVRLLDFNTTDLVILDTDGVVESYYNVDSTVNITYVGKGRRKVWVSVTAQTYLVGRGSFVGGWSDDPISVKVSAGQALKVFTTR